MDKADDIMRLTSEFVAAFNDNDIDKVMEYFSDDSTFSALDGTEFNGTQNIRVALSSMLGNLKFVEQDSFVDLSRGKVLTEWMLHTTTSKRSIAWRGLDILHWNNGQIALKSTFGKTKNPVLVE